MSCAGSQSQSRKTKIPIKARKLWYTSADVREYPLKSADVVKKQTTTGSGVNSVLWCLTSASKLRARQLASAGQLENRTKPKNEKVSCKAGAKGTSNRSVSAVHGSRGLFLPISRAAAAAAAAAADGCASNGETAAGY